MSSRIELLLLAVEKDDVECLTRNLTKQNVNFVDTERRMTLLIWAVAFRRHSIVELLLGLGASMYPCDIFQFNVFHHAAWCSDVKMLEILLYLPSSSGSAYACSSGSGVLRSTSRQFRPGSRALVDLPHPYTGRTPLMLAAIRGDASTVDFLIREAGSSLTLTDFRGNTAMDLAARCGHKAVVNIFLSRGDDNADLVFEGTRRQAEANCEEATTVRQLEVQKDLSILLCSEWLPQSFVALS
ncbi:putative ankyrin repeat protein [Trypanosoma rangeli]|uniref:Putative ankyrin repeat protein n=1 Tax=Trypanosoma rangeli TaxID=5698 RepID=A0A422NXA4_TRYRA|nr:putative ankyrin repeat protein [Trypanosoma rangeli]RNF10162.1 putative ankyrin repeat protein [Trypanosoma rangeli]|eukprot:RNF10162.1 putative ankyrin repeat protein [Trypanosoma rangeli]